MAKRTDFKEKWGISCKELAELEGVTCEAIRMRVRNFGTPFQRRGKPTKFEIKYGKTLGELALELGIHPITLARREYLYGDVYYTPYEKPQLQGKILNDRGEHWTENTKMSYVKIAPTYMEQHEKYNRST